MDYIDLARKHIEAENEHSVEKTMNTIAPNGADYVIFPKDESFDSREDINKFYSELIENIPDMHVEIQNIFQDKDSRQVCSQYVFTGTHNKYVWGLAPTGKQFKYNGSIVYNFDENGKLTKEQTYFDKMELLYSIGKICNPNSELGLFWLLFTQRPFYALKCLWYKLFKK